MHVQNKQPMQRKVKDQGSVDEIQPRMRALPVVYTCKGRHVRRPTPVAPCWHKNENVELVSVVHKNCSTTSVYS